MTWYTPASAARTGLWPLGATEIRRRCAIYREAADAGRKPPADAIECIRVGTRYRVSDAALDAWVARQAGRHYAA